ncbi:hypothetical protein RM844_30730 [Streptomyces sp. DSM 44915]|uniref:Uncharacterized protein n=1 Tax=Streptomyces chisholmiae TaxID=3075540 RepID=A0ABU2K087_9ACTN|nr:hypothetical protein [Streptomyces sp. DSM 44915]MDT0270657.1 hypothetical protein [Streptomyces sp. DSM 44915]
MLPRRVWTDEEWQRVQLGYRAKMMEEKWHVFAEGAAVFLHRSWTGRGILAATFAPVDGPDGGWRIAEAVAERDPDRYGGTDDDYDCLMLELVLSAIVLGEPAAELRKRLVASMRSTGNPEAPAALVQHSALGQRFAPDQGVDGQSGSTDTSSNTAPSAS